MTRQIKTPADAVPHSGKIEGRVTVLMFAEAGKSWPINIDIGPFFTAAECVQIAEAYAKDVCGETQNELPYPSVMRAISEARERAEAWRAKFNEWREAERQ